jgi:integrase
MATRVLYREAINREFLTDSPVAHIKAPKSRPKTQKLPYFGHIMQFPKTRLSIVKTLASYGVTIHSLRKTYANFLKTNDVHVTTAAKFLGHSDPMVTLKIYTLMRDDEIDEIGIKLRARL